MAYVFDAERNASDVVILSAQDFAGPPLAVVELPVRVPFGFHGHLGPRPAVNHRYAHCPVRLRCSRAVATMVG
jgi:hypothetical protein